VAKSLLSDDECRVCFHVHPDGPCTSDEHAPGPDGEVVTPCLCDEYVDLEAEARIVVTVERHP